MEPKGVEGLEAVWEDGRTIGDGDEGKSRTSWMDWAECDRVAKGLKVWRPTEPGEGDGSYVSYRSLMERIDAYIRDGRLQRDTETLDSMFRMGDRGIGTHELIDIYSRRELWEHPTVDDPIRAERGEDPAAFPFWHALRLNEPTRVETHDDSRGCLSVRARWEPLNRDEYEKATLSDKVNVANIVLKAASAQGHTTADELRWAFVYRYMVAGAEMEARRDALAGTYSLPDPPGRAMTRYIAHCERWHRPKWMGEPREELPW